MINNSNACNSFLNYPIDSAEDCNNCLYFYEKEVMDWVKSNEKEKEDRVKAAEIIMTAWKNKSYDMYLLDLDISSLPDLSKFTYLEKLIINNCSLIKAPDLPVGLSYLEVRCTEIESLSVDSLLNLKHLDVQSNAQLSNISKLSNVMKHLEISGTSITELPKLPENLEYLGMCFLNIVELPERLPPKLRLLNINFTPINKLPQNRPPELEIIGFSEPLDLVIKTL